MTEALVEREKRERVCRRESEEANRNERVIEEREGERVIEAVVAVGVREVAKEEAILKQQIQ